MRWIAVTAIAGALLLLVAAPGMVMPAPVAIDLHSSLLPPMTPDHLLGTDRLGRDVLQLTAQGLWLSSLVGGIATAGALALGLALGSVAGLFSGVLDYGINTLAICVRCVPALFAAMVLASLFHPNATGTGMILAVFLWPVIFRQARAASLGAKTRDYIVAAEALGVGRMRISVRHLLPNVASSAMALVPMIFVVAIMAEAGLSLLGLGVPLPHQSLGSLIADGSREFRNAPALLWAPLIALIGLAVVVPRLGLLLLTLRRALLHRISNLRIRNRTMAERG